MIKKILVFLIIIVVIAAILDLTRDIIAKSALSAAVNAATGLNLQVKDVNARLLRSIIDIKGLLIFNPEGFKDRVMADIPQIYVDYDLAGFFKRKIHLREMRLNLKEFTVVKNEKGTLNLDSLKTIKEDREKTAAAKAQEKIAIKIDILYLKIGKVVYKDYSNSPVPDIREFNVDIDERYENITDLTALANVIIFKALAKTTIAALANFNIEILEKGVTGTLATATGVAKSTAEGAQAAIKGAGSVAKEVTNTAKETVGQAEEVVKNLFGKK